MTLAAAGDPTRIVKTRDQNRPHLVFEWHPVIGKVYAVTLPGRYESGEFVLDPGGKATAECVAEHCDNHGRFIGFVQTFLRGCKRGAAEAAKGVPWR